MKNLLGIKNINSHSELDSESINLMDNKELALIDFGSESGMTGGRGKCVVTPPEFLSSQSSLRNSTLPVQGGRFVKAGFTLAEGATHVSMPPIIAKAGFTLAEVLITLGIIGVVAAMTIPNLIANTRSAQYRSKFKKTISTLSQAARLSQSQYGFDYAGVDFKCGSNPAKEHPENSMTVCALLNGTLTGATYFSNLADIKDKNGKKYSVKTGYFFTAGPGRNVDALQAYLLADGTIVAISKRLGTQGICSLPVGYSLQEKGYDDLPEMYMSDCWGLIDVNGVSLPNKEVSCSSGSEVISSSNCIVKNDAQHMTDVYPVRFHDGIVEPATAAARYVLKTAK